MAETLAKTAPSRTPRHVVHVTEAPLGGVVTYLEELLSAQIAGMPDTQIELLTPEVNREALAGLEGPNFKMIAFPHRRGSKADLMRLGWRVIRHLRRTRPEILHIHSSFAGAAIRALAPLIPRGTKVIYCPHGWAFSRRGSKRMQEGVARVERALSRVTDRIICISDYERQEALHAGIAPEKLSVIDNGVSQLRHPGPEPKAEDAPRLIACRAFRRAEGIRYVSGGDAPSGRRGPRHRHRRRHRLCRWALSCRTTSGCSAGSRRQGLCALCRGRSFAGAVPVGGFGWSRSRR